MRNPQRIPIILNLLENNYLEFFKDCGLDEANTDFQVQFNLLTAKRSEIEEFWLNNPDLRLTQVFVNFDIIENFPGFWYYKEEVAYVLEKGFCNIEDICFWGVNFTKEGKRLPATIFKLLKELETDHIRAIIDFYEKQYGNTDQLNSKYLKYFQKRLLEENKQETDNLLKNL